MDLENYLKGNTIDVLLLDIELKNHNGLDLCKKIKIKYPNTYIVILSSHINQKYILKAIKNGASGYIVKNTTKNELILNLNKVINGELVFDNEIKNIFANQKKNQTQFSQNSSLTKREKEILQLISEQYTTKEIAEKLFISKHTVESHRSNLFLKTGAKNIAGLLKIGYDENLI